MRILYYNEIWIPARFINLSNSKKCRKYYAEKMECFRIMIYWMTDSAFIMKGN